jgi:hypothetical protein
MWNNFFHSINPKQIENLMNNTSIIDEGKLLVNKKGEIIKPNSKGDKWLILYKESDDYIFTNFHSGWNIVMKEENFISKFMKESEIMLNITKYNI